MQIDPNLLSFETDISGSTIMTVKTANGNKKFNLGKVAIQNVNVQPEALEIMRQATTPRPVEEVDDSLDFDEDDNFFDDSDEADDNNA